MAPLTIAQQIAKQNTTKALIEINKAKRIMKHPEDRLHKQIANYLAQLENIGKFGRPGFFTYMPFGEKRNAITGSLLKSKGTKKGVPDFMVIFRDNKMSETLWIECKSEKGKQSEEQKEFELKTKQQVNENYIVVKSCDELADYFETIGLFN